MCVCVGGGDGEKGEGNRGMGRPSWAPAKMAEGLAFPSPPTPLLPGKPCRAIVAVFSHSGDREVQSDTHRAESKTGVYSEFFLPLWVHSVGQRGRGGSTFDL